MCVRERENCGLWSTLYRTRDNLLIKKLLHGKFYIKLKGKSDKLIKFGEKLMKSNLNSSGGIDKEGERELGGNGERRRTNLISDISDIRLVTKQ